MKNILIIVENLPVPLDRRVWQEATALARSGYGVFVICPKAGKYTKPYEELEGVKIYRHSLPFEGGGVVGYFGEYACAWLAEFWLALKITFEHHIDAIQACNPPDNIFLIAGLLRWFTGAKYVFDHHDPFAELFALKFPKQPVINRIVSWFERHSLRSADQVITTSEELRRMAISQCGVRADKIELVRSGFDMKRVRDAVSDPVLRRGREHLAIYIGVMGAQDGLNLLLEAAAAVVYGHGRKDIQFVLAGGGSDMPAMQRLCTELNLDDYVYFAGYLEGASLYNLLATAEIGLCPDPKNSFNDKLSMNKILEYMAFKLPIVQFDLNEGRFLAADAAVYATNNDPKELARAILQLIDDPELRARMGEIGRQRVTEHFAWEKQERLYLDTYEKLLFGDPATVSAIPHSKSNRQIFGFLPTPGTVQDTANIILRHKRTEAEGVGLVVTPNIHHIAQLRLNAAFRAAYRHAAMILCDGWPVYSYARRRGHNVKFVTGCDLISDIFDRMSPTAGHRLFLMVDSPETERIVRAWAETAGISPSLKTVIPEIGFLNNKAWCEATAESIKAFEPTLLIMCVGAPQSEIFVETYRSLLPPCWALCVGQAVKIKLGVIRRAPVAIRWLRAEWMWRLLQEPRRMAPRYLHAASGFIASVIDDLRGRRHDPGLDSPKSNIAPN